MVLYSCMPRLTSAFLRAAVLYSMDMHWSYTVTPTHLGLTAEGCDYPSLCLGTYTVTSSYNYTWYGIYWYRTVLVRYIP